MEYTIKSSLFRSLTVSLFPCTLSTNLRTIWWHHHIPWYLKKEQRAKSKQQNDGIFLKRFFEKFFIIPCIDEMIATSHFVAESIRDYCGRDAQVIHPVLERLINPGVIVAPTPGLPGPGLHLFTHGRLEPGKGIDTIVRVWKALQAAYHIDPLATSSPVRLSSRLEALKGALVTLTIFGTGSLEQELRDQGIEVRPFDGVRTFESLKSGLSLGLYCSTIDAFGLSPLEAQDAGLSTIILDKGGARETLLSTMSGESVGYLVETVEELFSTAKYFCEHKKFPKPLSNVNYFHTRDYFSEERLSGDLLLLISKTK